MKGLWLLALALLASLPALAHVGSPDVFVETAAGQYRLYITVQPPKVIPGVAAVQVRVSGPAVTAIQMAPMPMTGEGASHPPAPDTMRRSIEDPRFFTGSVWLMRGGSWQVRFQLDGAAGSGVVSVPVPAIAISTLRMPRGLGALLALLAILLIAGVIGISAAALREAHLRPGALPGRRDRRRAVLATAISLVVMLAVAGFGAAWWNAQASYYAGNIYQPLLLHPSLNAAGVLKLDLATPDGEPGPRLDDFIPDHNHLMHLYAVRWPALDVVYHLHPERRAPASFQLELPAMPPGEYRIYADVVHASGFPETLTAQITVPPNLPSRPLTGDDATGSAAAVSDATLDTSETRLPDGYRMNWDRPSQLVARQPLEFRFKLLDQDGNPPRDMALYMGMTGHAAFIKEDGTVFAHVHPSGTAAMAAMMMASAQNSAAMEMPQSPENTVTFPYGFPSAGRYRIIVQMKHGSTIETGMFDANVESR